MSNFGDRLKAERTARNMSQSKLAELCSTSEVVIRGFEKSRRKPSYDSLIKICNALMISPAHLLQDELSFNPDEGKSEMYHIIDKLSPKQLSFLKEFLNTLQKQ